ncbi:23S rRNA (guanosine(2251)-2'-O)-methyltransferase RlmB [Marinospirillum sp.]|uniref:23S rRNA (guanosine(2251)-2'-O)-methyltransferase RlmB n=1 Tax=Marinospirillum sp. TaxID=2183934 RepID=UPI003A867A6C
MSASRPVSKRHRVAKRTKKPPVEAGVDQVKLVGFHAVTSVLKHRPQAVMSLQVQEERADQRMQDLIHLAQQQGVALHKIGRADLDAQADEQHQGVVAWVQPRQAGSEADLERLLETLTGSATALFLVLDGVTDPHNLGACLRTAEAAGVQAIITPKDRSATLNAAARKVASGAAEILPLIQVTNLARALRTLKDYGVWVVGTAGEAEDLIYQADLTRSTALVMGAEGKGMRRLTREQCDQLVRLPMAGDVSSLNVSVAAGVALYEAVRQRLAV